MAKAKQASKNRTVQGPSDQLLTVQNVADLLAVSATTVYRLKRRGELPFVKVGGSLRFRAQDVAAFARPEVVTSDGYARRDDAQPSRLQFAFPVKRRRSGFA